MRRPHHVRFSGRSTKLAAAIAAAAGAIAVQRSAVADVNITPVADTATGGFTGRYFNNAANAGTTTLFNFTGAATATQTVGTGGATQPLNITFNTTTPPPGGVGTVNGTNIEKFAAQ